MPTVGVVIEQTGIENIRHNHPPRTGHRTTAAGDALLATLGRNGPLPLSIHADNQSASLPNFANAVQLCGNINTIGTGGVA